MDLEIIILSERNLKYYTNELIYETDMKQIYRYQREKVGGIN